MVQSVFPPQDSVYVHPVGRVPLANTAVIPAPTVKIAGKSVIAKMEPLVIQYMGVAPVHQDSKEQSWKGSNCDKVCDPGAYGQDCSKQCQCMNSASCNPVDGSCNCTYGFKGSRKI
ncbi:UNVERIFIED_CONTAM: drpr [Trichonephila clavipes]